MQSSMTKQVSSFQKKSKIQGPLILGTKLSVQNAQLLVSTGVPSLDHVIGGGIAVGTIIIIEEDTYGSYSKVLLKYFLSEGIVCGHSLLVASQDRSVEKIVSNLPNLATEDIASSTPSGVADDKLAIAWRYQSLKAVQTSPSSTAFGHHFDLTTTIPAETLSAADIHYWPDGDDNPADTNFHDPAFAGLLSRVQSVSEGFRVGAAGENRSVLRVAIDGLGSPLWGTGTRLAADLSLFLYSLRGMLRQAYAVAVVTLPALVTKVCMPVNKDLSLSRRLRHLSDVAIGLESFAGSARATHPLFRDLHGLVHLNKMAAVNCLPVIVATQDLGFKLRRKKFLIETLHLPPELQESMQREQDDITSTGGGCGGGAASPLDF